MRWYLAISVSILQRFSCLAFVLVEYDGIRRMWNMVLPYLKHWFSLLSLFFNFQKCKSYAFISSVIASDYVQNLSYCSFFSYCSFTLRYQLVDRSRCEEFFTAFDLRCFILDDKLRFCPITLFLNFLGVFIVEIQREQLFCLVCHNRWWISLYLYLGKGKSVLCRRFFHTVC